MEKERYICFHSHSTEDEALESTEQRRSSLALSISIALIVLAKSGFKNHIMGLKMTQLCTK